MLNRDICIPVPTTVLVPDKAVITVESVVSDLGHKRKTGIDASTSVDVSDNGTTPTSVVTAGRQRQRRRRQKIAERRSPGRQRHPGELIFEYCMI